MNIEAIILAAGKGTRMKSDLPKVMHNVAGKPMIAWIIEALKPVCNVLNVVTGHGREIVEVFIGKNFPDVKFSFQEVQNGTGGAVRAAIPNVSDDADSVLICAGDTPLIKTETFEKAEKFFAESGSDLLIVSTILDDAGSYGRILRSENGDVAGIVEFLDADESQREIKEINSGIYLVDKRFLTEAIYKLKNNNAKKEYYLTDIVKIAVDMHKKVTAYVEHDSFSLSGINDREQLNVVEKVLLNR
jgi:bifunctional UDP-N-acetylglucosamine pyrophosphorylase/glucosamine-1-phosphate N-acetyltransferase